MEEGIYLYNKEFRLKSSRSFTVNHPSGFTVEGRNSGGGDIAKREGD
ncbi:hypothetical protein [Peribacillus sp. SCS-37]